MNTSTAVVQLHTAVIARGQRAWTRIKTTAAEQRALWREVGEALRYGRSINTADRDFSTWCIANGFDMARSTRADAMWLAENWCTATVHLDPELTHPKNIRQAHRESQPDLPPSPELALPVPSKLTAGIEVVAPIAKTVNKLAAMVDRGFGQERETAKKYLDKKAKALGMETEELTVLAKKLDPAAGVAPHDLPVLQATIVGAAKHAAVFAAYIKSTQQGGMHLSREMAISILLQTLDLLHVE